MPYRLATPHCGVNGGNRTLDLQSHNLALYRLSYIHHAGASGRIRTCNLCLRRALLYPAELQTLVERVKGIGPSQPAWKAGALPLSYTRITFATLKEYHIILFLSTKKLKMFYFLKLNGA